MKYEKFIEGVQKRVRRGALRSVCSRGIYFSEEEKQLLGTDVDSGYSYWVCQDCWDAFRGVEDPYNASLDKELMFILKRKGFVDGEDYEEFSFDRCEGCGSRSGGSRYKLIGLE